jgi:hypothetical protein
MIAFECIALHSYCKKSEDGGFTGISARSSTTAHNSIEQDFLSAYILRMEWISFTSMEEIL